MVQYCAKKILVKWEWRGQNMDGTADLIIFIQSISFFYDYVFGYEQIAISKNYMTMQIDR